MLFLSLCTAHLRHPTLRTQSFAVLVVLLPQSYSFVVFFNFFHGHLLDDFLSTPYFYLPGVVVAHFLGALSDSFLLCPFSLPLFFLLLCCFLFFPPLFFTFSFPAIFILFLNSFFLLPFLFPFFLLPLSLISFTFFLLFPFLLSLSLATFFLFFVP